MSKRFRLLIVMAMSLCAIAAAAVTVSATEYSATGHVGEEFTYTISNASLSTELGYGHVKDITVADPTTVELVKAENSGSNVVITFKGLAEGETSFEFLYGNAAGDSWIRQNPRYIQVLPPTVTGTWAGWMFTVDGDATEVAKLKVYVNEELQDDVKVSVGANDFSALADKYSENGAEQVIIEVKYSDSLYWERTGIGIKTNVEVDTTSQKDTTFTYEISSFVKYEEYTKGKTQGKPFASGVWISLVDAESVFEEEETALFINTIVLKAGEKSATGYLYYGDNDEAANTPKDLKDSYEQIIGCVVREVGNDGNYSKNSNVYVFAPMLKNEFGAKASIAGFENEGALNSFIDTINNSEKESATKMLADAFVLEEMTFEHKGVQTADTNELGLWIALFAIAAVCGGAVALKKN